MTDRRPFGNAPAALTLSALLLPALIGCGGDGGGTPGGSRPSYRAVAVDPDVAGTAARDVSDAGWVVGTADTGQAFLWTGDGTRAVRGTAARAVNDRGQVAGELPGESVPIACRWEADGTVSLLTYGTARGINAAGSVVGEALVETGALHAFRWDGQRLLDLGTLGGTWSVAYDINDADRVVGWAEDRNGRPRATVWEDGTARDLGTLGGDLSMAYAVNDRGEVVGYAATGDDTDHAFLADPDAGWMLDLGSLGGYSVAYDVNGTGEVVGESLTRDGRVHAFHWEDGRMSDLNDRIDPASGWVLVRALGINDQGLIVGQGLWHGQARAFLLEPSVPE